MISGTRADAGLLDIGGVWLENRYPGMKHDHSRGPLSNNDQVSLAIFRPHALHFCSRTTHNGPATTLEAKK